MSISNCTKFVQKYKWHWNRKLLSLLGSALLKVLEMQTLVLLESVVGLGVWLVLRVLKILANCLLVLLLYQGFNQKQVYEYWELIGY